MIFFFFFNLEGADGGIIKTRKGGRGGVVPYPGTCPADPRGPSWGPFANSSPDFVTVTFFWPFFLQVTSDLPQVLNFVLQGFDLRARGEEAMGLWGVG